MVPIHVLSIVLPLIFGWKETGIIIMDCWLTLIMGVATLKVDRNDNDRDDDDRGGGGRGKFLRNTTLAAVGGYYLGKKLVRA